MRHRKLFIISALLTSLFVGVGLLVAQVNPSPEGSDQAKFLKSAALGAAWRTDLSRIAVKQTATRDVTEFATLMISRGTALGKELDLLAAKKNVVLSRQYDGLHQNTLAYMSGRQGAALDREYVSAAADDLALDIRIFKRESASGKDPEIKAFAASAVKDMEEDLRRAERLLKELPQPILK